MINLLNTYPKLEQTFEIAKHKNLDRLLNRVLSELKFVATLSQKQDGIYDALIEKCNSIIEKAFQVNGGITVKTVEEIEQVLSPVASEAKSYEFLCVAHAHIDMNWMWGYNETVNDTVDTFRTMITMLNEYKDFHFSQSQASVYKIIEEHDDELLAEIKKYINEGRWEVTASTWVETDKNLPIGESLARHILYTKKYLEEEFGLNQDNLVIDFEPDTFGHNKNVPEILTKGGIKYYYHCRGHIGDKILYRWQAPSGSEIIVYTEPFWYNATVDYSIAEYATTIAELTGSKTMLKVYGVGNHGGGPTRRDIEKLIEMNSWPIYPKFTFSTLKKYFDIIEPLKANFPVLTDEINFLCDGCYTTQTTIKEGNRKSEALLNEAEIFSVMASQEKGHSYNGKRLEKAWQKTLFNQFHDIIPGSGVTETREYASGLYQQIIATADITKKSVFKKVTDHIDTSPLFTIKEDISASVSEGAGAGFYQYGTNAGRQRVYHIFNSSVVQRTEVTEIVIWDYEGDYNKLVVRNSKGEILEHQLLKASGHYWGHNYQTILVEVTVPACGYETIVLFDDAQPKPSYAFVNDMRTQYVEEFILENDKLKVTLDPLTGAIRSMIDKGTLNELIDNIDDAGVFKFAIEAVKKEITGWNGGMSAWFTGRYKHIENVNDNVEMIVHEKGKLKQTIVYETKFHNSTISVAVSLTKGSSAIEYKVTCDWREFGDDTKGVPTLFFSVPLGYACQEYQYDIPFGTTYRKEANIERPANSFIFAKNNFGEKSLMILSKSKYAFKGFNNSMDVTLIRGAYDPDKTPEIKTHTIEFAINVLKSGDSDIDKLNDSYHFNHPLSVVSGTNHKGDLPSNNSFIKLLSKNIVISAIKQSEYGNEVIIRLYEVSGERQNVTLEFNKAVKSAKFVDITERHEVEGHIKVTNNEINFYIEPNQVQTIALEL